MITDKKSQADYRVFREFTDQHGRVFEAWSDMATNQPIGELNPKGFSPPWLPPMRFATWQRVGDLHFRWEYQKMSAELSGDTAAYYQDAVKFALENNKPEPEIGGPVDRSVRYVLGPPPISPAIPLAAHGGEPWILGVTGAPVNEALKAILEQHIGANGKEALDAILLRLKGQMGDQLVPQVHQPVYVPPKVSSIYDTPDVSDVTAVTYQSFMAEARKRGMSMADIALAWKEHKANLADELADTLQVA